MINSEFKQENTNILVVDDFVESLQLLEQLLGREGYTVRLMPDSTMVMMAARSNPPDLILLDIMMPELDGYEVCRQLKNDASTKDIPVIFLSALGEPLDKVKAFDAGGVDYIVKPFQREEVLARVSTHLNIRFLMKQLEKSNQVLEQRVTEKTEELAISFEEKLEIQKQLQQAGVNLIPRCLQPGFFMFDIPLCLGRRT